MAKVAGDGLKKIRPAGGLNSAKANLKVDLKKTYVFLALLQN